MKASNLLPLNVPVGKPILSCNATQLLQAQINLDGVIYDCKRAAITKSCPKIDNNNNIVDDCEGETLECDVKMRLNSRDVSCTNGTLISNHPIVCRSATIMPTKNVLNCLYKTSDGPAYTSGNVRPGIQQTIPPSRPSQPSRTTRVPINVIPIESPQTSIVPPPVNEEFGEGQFSENRGGSDNSHYLESHGLLGGEVQHAIKPILPKDLLTVPESKMYLPPHPAGSRRIPDDLKNHLKGVFPFELFAMSQKDDEALNSIEHDDQDNVQRLSTNWERNENSENQATLSENRRSEWDFNSNRKTVNPGTSFKTQQHSLDNRFSGTEASVNDDRVIFSP